MKFSFFKTEKNLCILHGQVFVMFYYYYFFLSLIYIWRQRGEPISNRNNRTLNRQKAAHVAERLRMLFLKYLIISQLGLMRVPASHWPHVMQAKLCFRVYREVFLGVLPFSPHLLIGASHKSWNKLERDVI